MLKKNTLALLLAAGLAASGLAVWPAASLGGERPSLSGVFGSNFSFLDKPVPASRQSFENAVGEQINLADFAGQVVLLNFWATWCGPCVQEMPSLDRLQTALRGDGLVVLAVSEDRGGLGKVAPFVSKMGLTALDIYLDPKGRLSRIFRVSALPTTFLIDRQGRVIGSFQGAAEWDGQEAEKLIRFYLEQGAPPSDDGELIQTKG